jgi:predicted phage terminase large subunit-like protein
VVAAGVGGPITGHGAALGIIDDPFENWEQAQSQNTRDRVWDWWRGTFRTRVWENGAIVVIMTRWHEDDLCGRLLSEQADRWTVLRLPALAETQSDRDQRNKKLNLPLGEKDPLGRSPGEPLCPSRFSREALEEIRTDSGSLVWSAQYDGAPTLPEGNKFKRHWFPIVDASPANARRCRYWDFAATSGGGARTAGVKLSILKGEIFVEDIVKGQWSTDPRNKIMKQTADLDTQTHGRKIPQWFEEEGGSSGKDASRAIIKYMAGHIIKPDRPTGSKDVRLEPFAAQAEAGNVKLVRGKWNGEYIEEMCAIPNGRFRDQADGTSGAYNKLARSGWARGVV